MKILFSMLLLGLIGFTVPSFAEEMYPHVDISEVNVNVSKFQEINDVIVNLLFNEGDIGFSTNEDWINTLRFGLIIDYTNSNGTKTYINMNNTTFEPLGNVEINKFYDGGDKFEDHQVLGFTFSNLNEIFPQGTTSQSVSFELSSTEIKFGMATDDVYNVEIVKYGIESDYTTFDLNDSKQIEPDITSEDPTPAPMEMSSSIEEQMKLQEQQAIAEAEQRKQQRELEEKQNSEESEKAQTANPASIHCIENGGISEIIPDEDGSQYGMCTLSDGTQCGEWKYFRGECGTSQQITTESVPDPEPVMNNESIAEPVEEKQCGAGTTLKDGYCKVIADNTESNEPVKEQKGFFEWLMSLFGM